MSLLFPVVFCQVLVVFQNSLCMLSSFAFIFPHVHPCIFILFYYFNLQVKGFFSAAGYIWRCCPLMVFMVTAQVNMQLWKLQFSCISWRFLLQSLEVLPNTTSPGGVSVNVVPPVFQTPTRRQSSPNRVLQQNMVFRTILPDLIQHIKFVWLEDSWGRCPRVFALVRPF